MRLCLNMIVRNESLILERCLRSVLPYLDCYVIGDTGSTDHTVDLIHGVFQDLPGRVVPIEFHNFSQARNQALELAQKSDFEFDYLLLLDADMELTVQRPDWKSLLSGSAYLVRQTGAGVSYLNTRLLPRDAQARYIGATHEYLEHDRAQEVMLGISMLDHACGSSRAHKTERDLRLLESALQENPEDARAVFYLAQTLREAGRVREAADSYQRRIELGGWSEEVWYARYMLAFCYQGLGDIAAFVQALLDAYQARPTRAEPLYVLAKYFRLSGQNELSLLFCEEGLGLTRPDDLLFLEDEVYRSGFRQEFSIAGFYSVRIERRERARGFCRELALESGLPQATRENARANWRHYAQSLDQLFPATRFMQLEHQVSPGFRLCNPSIAVWNGELWGVLRSVNYHLLEPHYCSEDGVIRTENFLCRFDDELRPIRCVPITDQSAGRLEHSTIQGLEDIRLIPMGERLMASATVADRNPNLLRQFAVFEVTKNGEVKDLTVQRWGGTGHQKNWVPLVAGADLFFLYLTDPTTVLKWDPKARQCELFVQPACSAALDNQRGSSQAIPFEDGWLYVTHEVSYQRGVRVYLHRFIALNENFQVQTLTDPFFFHRVGVEFCCGLAVEPKSGDLILTFGVEDRQAWMALVSPEQVKEQLFRIGQEGSAQKGL